MIPQPCWSLPGFRGVGQPEVVAALLVVGGEVALVQARATRPTASCPGLRARYRKAPGNSFIEGLIKGSQRCAGDDSGRRAVGAQCWLPSPAAIRRHERRGTLRVL